MPKLPQQNKTSVLEVLDKRSYSTGEITFPKVPKHHVVFRHHFKLSLILLAIAVMLGLVFVAGKPLFNDLGKEEVVVNEPSKLPNSDVQTSDSFGEYTDKDFESVKAENRVLLVVDKVDVASGILEGEDLDNPGKRYKVRVVEKSQIFWVSAPDESGVGGGVRTQLSLDDVKNGGGFEMFVIEDPAATGYLTVISARRVA